MNILHTLVICSNIARVFVEMLYDLNGFSFILRFIDDTCKLQSTDAFFTSRFSIQRRMTTIISTAPRADNWIRNKSTLMVSLLIFGAIFVNNCMLKFTQDMHRHTYEKRYAYIEYTLVTLLLHAYIRTCPFIFVQIKAQKSSPYIFITSITLSPDVNTMGVCQKRFWLSSTLNWNYDDVKNRHTIEFRRRHG